MFTSASAGTPETLYTVQTGSTIVMLGLILANVHTSQVTVSSLLWSAQQHKQVKRKHHKPYY